VGQCIGHGAAKARRVGAVDDAVVVAQRQRQHAAIAQSAVDQGRLVEDRSPAAVRRARIAEAVGQLRQAVGPEAALRVLEVDPGSRLPERRAVLAPYPVEDDPR